MSFAKNLLTFCVIAFITPNAFAEKPKAYNPKTIQFIENTCSFSSISAYFAAKARYYGIDKATATEQITQNPLILDLLSMSHLDKKTSDYLIQSSIQEVYQMDASLFPVEINEEKKEMLALRYSLATHTGCFKGLDLKYGTLPEKK